MEIEGIGPVAFPLLPWQAEQIRAVAEPAPYGRGAETLVDDTIRRSWQLGPDRVRLKDPRWEETIAEIIRRTCAVFGLTQEIRSEFYKLLLYDAGSFFVAHRDSEKTEGMFATLVVVLPSLYEGGELVVRHMGRELVVPLGAELVSQVSYAAFYADCLHELRPIRSGWRMALIYNVAVAAGPRPDAPDSGPELDGVTRLLQSWGDAEAAPEKLAVVLDHHYTSAGLSWSVLKGADAGRAHLLAAAAARSGCEAHLAMISIQESGNAEPSYDGYRSRHRYREDADESFEIIEVNERTQMLGEWRDPDDAPVGLTSLPLVDDEVCPRDAIDEESPDEQHFHEATGNEGATFERTWRRAALVIWPARRLWTIVNKEGFAAQVSLLGVLASRWARSGADRSAPAWRDARALSEHLITRGPWVGQRLMREQRGADLLSALVVLEDAEGIASFVREVILAGVYNGSENPGLVAASSVLGWARTSALLGEVVTRHALFQLTAVTRLAVEAVVAAGAEAQRQGLHDVATALVEALPGDPARVQGLPAWPRPQAPDAPLVEMLLGMLGALSDEALGRRAVAHMLRWPAVWPVDGVLLPALRDLWSRPTVRSRAEIVQLRAAVVAHLEARVALPLEAPRDWRRPDKVACSCEDCRDLRVFLADPAQPAWRLKAHKDARSHVEGVIRRDKLDLDCETERRGSPHTLICTKNQQSYLRRIQQHKEDLEALQALGARA